MPEEKSPREGERRRNPRFSCGGMVQIVCLPSDGILLPGKIRDLSLGGCSIQMGSPIQRGSVAEILVRVSASSFRALAQVREVRGPAGVGVQFLQMSAGGQDMLAELVRELARQQAIARVAEAARRGPDAEFFVQRRAALFRTGLPIVEALAGTESGEAAPPVDRRVLIVEGELDLFA